MAEFDLIHTYFAPLSGKGAGGLLDDGAVLDIPAGHQLVVSSDTSNRGDHFVEALPPADAAKKCLRSNLSDLAAMGADPFVYQLNLALPKEIDEAWLKEFASGLAADQEEFGIVLSGGDTTGMTDGGLSVSITAMGLVPTGTAVPRGGAQAGDLAVVTGELGAACLNRLHLPYPRTAISALVRKYARAAVDISDGLPADLGHICEVSGLGAELVLENIPLAQTARDAIKNGEKSAQELLVWGEDYELALAVQPENIEDFTREAEGLGVPLAVTGVFTAGDGVEIMGPDGKPLVFDKMGWTHF